jgi:hypothetical protein
MTRVAAAAIAVLVLLAGCGSVAPSGGETPTRTVTAVPIPQDTPTPRGPPVLAPGLSTEGVFDAARLADAHERTLSRTSFTAVREERRRYTNGSFRSRYRSVVRMSAEGDRFRYALNQTDVRDGQRRPQRLARYADGSVVYSATTRGGETTYSVLGGPADPTAPSVVFPDNATARFGVARLFGAMRFEVIDRRTVDGREVYDVGVAEGSRAVGGLRNVSMNATVREDGVVVAYRLAYDVSDIRVIVDVDFRRIGGTEVAPPGWLPAARNATGVGAGTAATAETGTTVPTAETGTTVPTAETATPATGVPPAPTDGRTPTPAAATGGARAPAS